MVAYILVQTDVGVIGDGDQGRDRGRSGNRTLRRHRQAEATILDELGRLVIQRIQSVQGVSRTLTCPVLHE